MIARFSQALCLCSMLAACDKPKPTAPAAEDSSASPRLTKSRRPAPTDLPQSRDQLIEAFRRAEEVSSPEEKARALTAAIWDALDVEPELARRGLQKLIPGSEEKNRLIQHMAMRLAEHNVDDAVQWAKALETEEEKSLAFGKIALVLSEAEPARAAQLLSDSGIAGREFDVAVVQVVQRWAAQAPADAAAWVGLFDPGEARSGGLKEIAAVWARNDPQAAFTWIAAISDEQIRGQAGVGMAEVILEQPDAVQPDMLKLATPEIRTLVDRLRAERAVD